MKSTSRLSRRMTVMGGILGFLLVCGALYPSASTRLEASPLDKLRAWCGGGESPCACDKGRCNKRPSDAGCYDEDVDGEWFWVRSPDQEKRKVAGLYNRYCIRCHGVDGRGVWDIPGVPDFTNVRWQETRSDAQRARIIIEGRGAVMPPFRGALTVEEAWAVGRYLHTFVPGTEVSRPDIQDGKPTAVPDGEAPAPKKPEPMSK
jgi:Cytochrome C oxidase, cbb3-type, subunit III